MSTYIPKIDSYLPDMKYTNFSNKFTERDMLQLK